MNHLLFNYLKQSQGFASPAIAQAFQDIDRADFLPSQHKERANSDHPISIGHGATNSQPSTVLFMINRLNPMVGEKILDIGAGSGWTTALLASAVGEKGLVIGTELVPELVEFANSNLAKYKFSDVQVLQAKKLGLPEQQPYDKILVSAAATELPDSLVRQLKVHGRLVIPIKSSVWRVDRISEDEVQTLEYPGFSFVPLII
jgi:protein-L-isoaspartate(D-aspartate) O-methyltransferase